MGVVQVNAAEVEPENVYAEGHDDGGGLLMRASKHAYWE